jgi:WD40 repeat protein
VLKGHKSWVNSLAFAPDTETLASASSDNTVQLWDAPERKHKATLRPNAAELRSIAFSPDGRFLAAGTRYGLVQVWDAMDLNEKATLRGSAGDVWAIAFDFDGKTLASGDGDWNRPGNVRLWDTETWKERSSLRHTGEVLSLAFAAKSRLLAAGSWDKTVKIWDTGTELFVLPRPRIAR